MRTSKDQTLIAVGEQLRAAQRLAIALAQPVDRYTTGYPDYAPEIRPDTLRVKLTAGEFIVRPRPQWRLHIIPGQMPEGWLQRRRYGRHSKANTKAARASDPRQFFRVRDAILNQVSERRQLASVGRPAVRRSA